MSELDGTWLAWSMLIGPGSIYIIFVLYLITTVSYNINTQLIDDYPINWIK